MPTAASAPAVRIEIGHRSPDRRRHPDPTQAPTVTTVTASVPGAVGAWRRVEEALLLEDDAAAITAAADRLTARAGAENPDRAWEETAAAALTARLRTTPAV